MISDELNDFAARYAKAWCSQNPESVAAFFAGNGSLQVNDAPPAVGGRAIGDIARGFMRDFPNMTVTCDKIQPARDRTAFHWTLTGTHAATGKHVRISGCELWKFSNDGLIAESTGHFDAAEYERQLKGSPEL